MPLFLDTEFSNFKGELISIALVHYDGTINNENCFYGELEPPEDCNDWINENVIPKLVGVKEPIDVLRHRLFLYLQKNQHEVIIADWPEDFVHLLNLLYFENGVCYGLHLDMKLISSKELNINSEKPHHAFYDALALAKGYYESKSREIKNGN